MDIDETIVCVDCGGVCHLTSTWPEDDPPIPGDVLVYRCSDCHDRWDLVIPDEACPSLSRKRRLTSVSRQRSG